MLYDLSLVRSLWIVEADDTIHLATLLVHMGYLLVLLQTCDTNYIWQCLENSTQFTVRIILPLKTTAAIVTCDRGLRLIVHIELNDIYLVFLSICSFIFYFYFFAFFCTSTSQLLNKLATLDAVLMSTCSWEMSPPVFHFSSTFTFV